MLATPSHRLLVFPPAPLSPRLSATCHCVHAPPPPLAQTTPQHQQHQLQSREGRATMQGAASGNCPCGAVCAVTLTGTNIGQSEDNVQDKPRTTSKDNRQTLKIFLLCCCALVLPGQTLYFSARHLDKMSSGAALSVHKRPPKNHSLRVQIPPPKCLLVACEIPSRAMHYCSFCARASSFAHTPALRPALLRFLCWQTLAIDNDDDTQVHPHSHTHTHYSLYI